MKDRHAFLAHPDAQSPHCTRCNRLATDRRHYSEAELQRINGKARQLAGKPRGNPDGKRPPGGMGHGAEGKLPASRFIGWGEGPNRTAIDCGTHDSIEAAQQAVEARGLVLLEVETVNAPALTCAICKGPMTAEEDARNGRSRTPSRAATLHAALLRLTLCAMAMDLKDQDARPTEEDYQGALEQARAALKG